jgi:hypothetical protein
MIPFQNGTKTRLVQSITKPTILVFVPECKKPSMIQVLAFPMKK